mgnify:CR=1 FL=1
MFSPFENAGCVIFIFFYPPPILYLWSVMYENQDVVVMAKKKKMPKGKKAKMPFFGGMDKMAKSDGKPPKGKKKGQKDPLKDVSF